MVIYNENNLLIESYLEPLVTDFTIVLQISSFQV
jgi:hypothetical protein